MGMDKDIELLLKQSIQAKVIEALNSTPEMIEKLIASAFSQKVMENTGQPKGPHSYYNDKEVPWLDWLVGQEIRNAAKQAVSEYMAEHREAITAKIKQAIDNGEFGSHIANVVADVMSKDYNWKFNIDVNKHGSD